MSHDWDRIRAEEFPVAARWAYLDHAAVAPLPRRAGDVMRSWISDQEANGVVHWPDWERKLETGRRRIAKLLNAEPDEIAYINSTTHGIGLVAEGFPWREGDSVITAEEEYPSNVYPWMNLAARGVEFRRVPGREGRIWVDDLLAACDRTTRLVTISHVEFASGFRNDLDALTEACHARGIAVFVDAIQSLGPLTLDVRRTPVDFLAADGHKWLLGPEGAGFFYVRRDWIDRLRPILVGWHSVVGTHDHSRIDFTLKPSAQRWEGGSFTMPGLQAFGASLELLLEIGPEAVSTRILERAEAVRERARVVGWQVYGSTRPEDLSGIVSLYRDGTDPQAVVRALRAEGVAVACRGSRVRVSPHIYTSDDDLDRLTDGLRRHALNPATGDGS